MTVDDSRRALATQRLRRRSTTLTVPPRPPDSAPPLSFAQERMWFMDQYAPDSGSYLIRVSRRLRRAVDRQRLADAFGQVAARHEVLRSRFPGAADGVPTLVIDDAVTAELALADAEDEPAARSLVQALYARPFDLAVEPPVRGLLIRIAEDDHVLALLIHHIAADGWSVEILLREIMQCYDGRPLNDLKVQYGDYALWQRQRPDLGVEYWRTQLAGVEPLDLPTDRPRPPLLTYAGAGVDFELDADLAAALRRTGENHGATLYMTMLAAFTDLLGRYSGQSDITVGSPVAGRSAPELEAVVGCFVNTLVMRTDLAGDPSFNELLLRVRDTALDAFTHQDVPFEHLVQALNVTRDVSRPPLFQALLAVQNYLTGADDGLEGFDVGADSIRFDVELYLNDVGTHIWGHLAYNTDLFDRDTMVRLVAHLTALLRAVVAQPGVPLSRLDILSTDERARLAEWNNTTEPFDDRITLPELVAAQVARTPDAPALTFAGARLSYAELDARAEAIAALLRGYGARPGTRIGVCAQRSPELVAGLYGVLKTGAAYVPLDPDYPAERIAFMVGDAQLSALLTLGAPAGLADLVGPTGRGAGCPVIDLDDLADLSTEPEAALNEGSAEQPTATADDAAYVIYTSGSTGKPKGVPNGHRGIVNRLDWMQDRFGLTADDVVLQKTPAGFDVSVWEFFWPLITGARLVLAQPGGHKDAAYLRDLIVTEGVTTLHFVPSMLAIFLAESGLDACTSIRRIISSGEELPADLARRCVETLPGELHNLYGPTEAGIDVTAWSCTRDSLRGLTRVPIGAPVPNTTLHVLGPTMVPVPIGVPGELHIGGVQVAHGYLGRPRLTAERFLPDPFGPPGARLYKTGDRARWRPDGTIEYLGRLDDQVKLRGLRIELGEIATVLREQPGVEDAAVIVREDRPGDQRLVGYIVGATPDPAVLKRLLPDYMVPTAIVPVDALPLSPNGKLDRRALPVPVRASSVSTAVPTSTTEKAIAAIWTEVLDLASVGVDDSFFDLGGHSLLATRLVARLRAEFGAGISVLDVFKSPTIRELAALADMPAGERAPRGLLHELTPARPNAELSLVCVPYGGGSAVVYQPLADALPDTYTVWAVAIPGHDVGIEEKHLGFEELIDRCVAEIEAKVSGPLSLYGHCGVGSAATVAIARRLEATGRRIETVYLGAIFPFAKPAGRITGVLSAIGRMDRLTADRAYANWLTSTGVDLSNLDSAEVKQIIQNMRKDSLSAEAYYTGLFTDGVERLRAPFVTIAGTRDPATEYYQERFREWHFLTDESAVVVLEEAGHFFLKYRSAELAEIITAGGLEIADEQPERNWRVAGVSHGRTPSSGPQPSMRRFGAIAFGQFISMTGSALTEFAIPIWIYLNTGSVAKFALFAVLALVPGMLVLPFAGAVVDRYDRRIVMLGGDLAAGSVHAVLAALIWTGHLHVSLFYPTTVALSVALTFQRIAYGSAIPQLVPKRFLGHANGIGQLSNGVAQLITPLLAAGLLAAIGLKGIITIDVISYLFAVTVVALVRFPSAMAWRRKETLRAEILGGARYVWGNRHFRRMLLFFAVLNLPLSPLFLMISPLVLSFRGLHQVGQVSFCSAIGVLLGGITMTFWGGPRHRRMFAMLIATMGLAVASFVTGLRPSLTLIAVGAFGMAFGLTLVNGLYFTIVQVKVPQRLHGRVFALNTLIAWSTVPIGFGVIAPFASTLLEPLLRPDGALAGSVGRFIGTGDGRGIAFMYLVFAAAMLAIAAGGLRVLRGFDDAVPDAVADDLVGLQTLEAEAVPTKSGSQKVSLHE